MIRKIFATTLVVTVTWTTTWSVAPLHAQEALPSEQSYEDSLKRLDRFMDLLEQMRSHIDRSQFDLDACLEALDYNADRIIEFVSSEIHFEQYPGLLRGAQGTLMSRGGNALDQALLLATLLKDAGYDARIARSRITDALSLQLLQELAAPKRAAPSIGDETAIGEIVEELRLLVPGSQAEFELARSRGGAKELLNEGDESLRLIEGALAQIGVELGEKDVTDEVVEEAKDYFWVEYREGQESSWRSVHPVPADPKLFVNAHASSYIEEVVPEDLQFKLRIGASIEQRLGSRITTRRIMDEWERPTANLVGVPISLLAIPDTLTSQEGYTDIPASLRDTRFFIPLLNHQLAPGALAFDLGGNTVPPEALSGGAAGLFQELSKKSSKAIGALNSLSSTEASAGTAEGASLEAVTYTFAIVEPGGEIASYDRVLMRRDDSISAEGEDPQAGSSEAIAARLATEHTLMVDVGEYSPGYVLDYQVARLLQYRSILDAAREQSGSTDPASMEPLLSQMLQLDNKWYGHLFLFGAFATLPDPDPQLRIYRNQPGVILYKSRLIDAAGWRTALDIVTGAYRALQVADSTVTAFPRIVAQQGVRESFLESRLAGEQRQAGAASSLKDAAPKGLNAIQSVETGQLGKIGASAVARENISRDLEDGLLVVAPASWEQTPGVGWWRINPDTGETLAIRIDGSGGVSTEDVLLTVLVVGFVYAVAGAFQLYSCVEAGGGTICITCSLLTILFGVASAAMAGLDLASASITIPAHVAIAALIAAAIKEVGCSAVAFHYGGT